MKKCIVLGLLFLLLLCTAIAASAEEERRLPDDFTIYHIYLEELEELFNVTENADVFFSDKAKDIYTYNEEFGKTYVQAFCYDKYGNEIPNENYNRVMWRGEFVTLICSGNETLTFDNILNLPFNEKGVKEMLEKNQIYEEIEEYDIFIVSDGWDYYYYRLPFIMVWVKTSEDIYILGMVSYDIVGYDDLVGDYMYIDYDPQLYMVTEMDGYYQYGFKAYRIDEFKEKYLPAQYYLKIDGELQEQDENIQFISGRGFLPIFNIFNSIGVETEVNNDANEIAFRYSDGSEKLIYLGSEDSLTDKLIDFFDGELSEEEYIAYSRKYDGFMTDRQEKDGDIYAEAPFVESMLEYGGYYLNIDTNSKIVEVLKIPKVYIDGNELTFEKHPITENDRTLVPMRAIFEALEADVTWNNDTNTATAVKDGITISITIDSDVMYKNGEAIQLDAPARLIDDGYTFVPLRAVSEAFDCDVQWNEDLQRVDITTK